MPRGVFDRKPRIRIAREILFWRKVQKTDTCWLWTAAVDSSGYGSFTDPGGWGTVSAHRQSWRMLQGPIPEGLSVLHTCDVTRCVNPAHLFLGTQRDNMRDCQAKGRMGGLAGEDNPAVKLTVEKVKRIKGELGHLSTTVVGRMMGVSASLVGQIRRGTAWPHVTC